MAETDLIPQWLKEVLDRGFQPETVHRILEKTLFGYVRKSTASTSLFPDIRIFVLEGIPGSGKSTIWNMAHERGEVGAIPQILPHEPTFDQAESQSFYFRSDELKTKVALAFSKRLILMDRYYVSTLAFYWAFDKVHGTHEYERAFRWYHRAIATGRLIKPFTVFLVETPVELGAERKGRTLGENTEDLWCNTAFLNEFAAYYTHFYSTIEANTHLIRLSGTEALSILKTHIEEVIHGDKK